MMVGKFYLITLLFFLRVTKTFNHNKTMALELEKYKFLEIDDKIDLMLAKILIKSLKKKI